MTPSLPEDSLRSFPEAFRVGMAARADKLREYGPNEPLHYDRTGVLVEVLDRLRQVACTLGNHAERAVSEAAANYVLETDDGTPASDYTYEGRRLLADVAAGIEKATHIATKAHSALLHLKLAEPPQ